METHSFNFEGNRLEYVKWGNGKKTMLAFHGFGQHKAVFRNIGKALLEEFTFYSFDLFFHGESYLKNKKQALTQEYWKWIMEQFLAESKISTFSLMGFSMGGKFVFATLKAFPDKIEKITLIAPDGVKTSFWYNFAVYQGWTGEIFKRVIFNPQLFQKVAATLQRIKLVDKGLVRFAQSQLITREQRLRAYFTWIIFKEFKYEMNEIAEIINQKEIVFSLFLGRYDKVITENNMQKLLKSLNKYDLHILETGHNHLVEAVAKYYEKN